MYLMEVFPDEFDYKGVPIGPQAQGTPSPRVLTNTQHQFTTQQSTMEANIDLQRTIDYLRNKLHQAALQHSSLTDDEIVQISQKLDYYIFQLQKRLL